jgi:hypothetical protein
MFEDKECFVSIYQELCAAAHDHLTTCYQFYADANVFPEKLRKALCAHLMAAEHSLRLCSPSERPGPWPPLAPFGRGDEDPDGCFHFVIEISLGVMSVGQWLRFRPIRGGYEVFVPDRQWAYRAQHRGSRFEILNDDDAGWTPLLDECVKICREALVLDPFGEVRGPTPIGFYISDAENEARDGNA